MLYALLYWEDFIEVTGGCLSPNKSAWYLVDYKQDQGKWKCTNPDIKKTSTAKTKEGITIPLRDLKANESMEMLVIYSAPDGNNRDQVKYTRTKTLTWETSI